VRDANLLFKPDFPASYGMWGQEFCLLGTRPDTKAD